jgi:hypothetical protein
MEGGTSDKESQRSALSIVSETLTDGTIIELLYDERSHRTTLAKFNGGRWTIVPHLDAETKRRLIPFSSENNLIKNNVVLLPSAPQIYSS